jgi:hypothetical protein
VWQGSPPSQCGSNRFGDRPGLHIGAIPETSDDLGRTKDLPSRALPRSPGGRRSCHIPASSSWSYPSSLPLPHPLQSSPKRGHLSQPVRDKTAMAVTGCGLVPDWELAWKRVGRWLQWNERELRRRLEGAMHNWPAAPLDGGLTGPAELLQHDQGLHQFRGSPHDASSNISPAATLSAFGQALPVPGLESE